jgi:hypothetical protein
VLLEVNTALKKANFPRIESITLWCWRSRWNMPITDTGCHDFAFYRRHTPRPRGSQALNRDELHSDQSATISQS